MNIPKHMIIKRIHAKDEIFNVKWTFKDKNLHHSHH
jgi:hypothetical protein